MYRGIFRPFKPQPFYLLKPPFQRHSSSCCMWVYLHALGEGIEEHIFVPSSNHVQNMLITFSHFTMFHWHIHIEDLIMFEFGSRSFARPVPLLPDRRCSWRRVVETGAWQCWGMQQESSTSWTTAIQNPNEAWRNPLLSLPPATDTTQKESRWGRMRPLWLVQNLPQYEIVSIWLKQWNHSFWHHHEAFPCLTKVHFVPAKRCEHVASSPRPEQSAWSHIIISMGGAQLTFWRRQRPCAIPETFPSKIAGFTSPHLDITKDGWLPSFKFVGMMFKTLPTKDDIIIEMMENPVLFQGFLLGFGTSIYQRATCLPCWWNQSSSSLGSGLSGAPPPRKHVYIPR